MNRTLRLRLFGVALAAGPLAPLAPLASADVGSTLQTIHLPVPAGTSYSAVSGGDPTGRYLVGTAYLSEEEQATGLVWKNRRFTRIDASSVQHVSISYDDINRYGVVVGERMTDYASFHQDAFIYRDGWFSMLPAPHPGDDVEAVAINSRGDVVGNSWSPEGARIVVWPASRPGTVRVLTMPDGSPAEAMAGDIDEDGTVVGSLLPNAPATPYVWPADGTPRPLPIPEDSGGDARAIRLGMVAGNVLAPDPSDPSIEYTRPTLWNLRTGTMTMYEGELPAALSVNRWGTIGTMGSIIHADGRVVDLGSPACVEVVTDRGFAAGVTDLYAGQAVIWTGG